MVNERQTIAADGTIKPFVDCWLAGVERESQAEAMLDQ